MYVLLPCRQVQSTALNLHSLNCQGLPSAWTAEPNKRLCLSTAGLSLTCDVGVGEVQLCQVWKGASLAPLCW